MPAPPVRLVAPRREAPLGLRAPGRRGDRDEGARRPCRRCDGRLVRRPLPRPAHGSDDRRPGRRRRSRRDARGRAPLRAGRILSAFESRYDSPSLDGRDLDLPRLACSSRSRSCRSPHPLALLAAVPELGLNLLSSTLTQTSVKTHYAAVAIPAFLAAAVFGAARLSSRLAYVAGADGGSPACSCSARSAACELGADRALTQQPGARSPARPRRRPRQRHELPGRASLRSPADLQLPTPPRGEMGRRRRAAADVPRQPQAGAVEGRPRATAAQPALDAGLRRGRRARLPANLGRNRLREEVRAEAQRDQLSAAIVLGGCERKRPDHVPGREVGRGRQQQAAGQTETRAAAPRLTREPGQAGRESRDCDCERRPRGGRRAARAGAAGRSSSGSRRSVRAGRMRAASRSRSARSRARSQRLPPPQSRA